MLARMQVAAGVTKHYELVAKRKISAIARSGASEITPAALALMPLARKVQLVNSPSTPYHFQETEPAIDHQIT
jgi:hypothetical protein